MNQRQINQNNNQRATGVLRNGETYTARYLQADDISIIMQLQEKVKQKLQTKTTLEPLSQEEFTFILSGNGFMIGIFVAERLVGFRAMLIPELDDDHLGFDCGLSEQSLSRVIYSEVSCVDPEFRGNGLQTLMGKLLFAEVDTEQFYYICATVSPDNFPSIKDKLKLGMRIVALKEKYEGKMRFIMMKHLRYMNRTETDVRAIPVRIDNITAQQRLLRGGYCGVDIKEMEGTWNILYQ